MTSSLTRRPPFDVDLLPGTYQLNVYTPTTMLAKGIVTLMDGDVLELTKLIEQLNFAQMEWL